MFVCSSYDVLLSHRFTFSYHICYLLLFFFFSSRRRHTRCSRDWSSDVCSSDLFVVEEISGMLDACGCYARRDAAIRRLVPEYGEGWRCKLALEGGGLDSERLNKIGRASCRERG